MVSGGRKNLREGGRWSCDEYIMMVPFFILMLLGPKQGIL